MPFTPFHIVAGASIKSIAPRQFSWSMFTLTNIAIDFEPLYYFFTIGELAHRFFHTIIGASIIAVLSVLIGKPISEFGLKIWNSGLAKEDIRWFGTGLKISYSSAWLGAFIGAYSHLLLDSLMHHDIQPLSPFIETNSLLEAIPLETLHTICWASFGVGMATYIIRKIFR